MATPVQTVKQWGTSPPLSTALPEPRDNEKTADLIEELKRENNYEPGHETKKRMSTLSLLNKITQEFVKEVSREKGKYPIDQWGGKVIPYGSYRLGVFGPGSDIDTLAVAPQHVKKEDFFRLYPSILRRLAPAGAVSSLTAVPESFVPIIKLVLNDIEIDLIFASIPSLEAIPKDLSLNDNKLLWDMDQASVRAITGPRVTDEILSLVPEQKTFRTALRAIKLWAQRRAVYANIVGYPGGVAWAMLVARVCQLYPHAVGATIVDKFFFFISQWKFPNPILLKDIEYPKEGDKNKNLKVWNPAIYPGDKKNLMPVITPAFPSMCATYNISASGQKVIKSELKRGAEITRLIFEGKAQWSDLFKKHTFFTADHKFYLSVIASSTNADAAKAWSGLVESKVRILVQHLEVKPEIALARPFTKGVKRTHRCRSDAEITEVQKGSMKYQISDTTMEETTDPELVTSNGQGAAIPAATDAKPDQSTDGQVVTTFTFYIGLDIKDEFKGQLNISDAITAFKENCAFNFKDFNPEMHVLNLASTKCWDLPEDLFDSAKGEVRPKKPVKKAAKTTKRAGTPQQSATPNGQPSANSAQNASRRSINDVDGANPEEPSKRPKVTPSMTQNSTPAPTAAPA